MTKKELSASISRINKRISDLENELESVLNNSPKYKIGETLSIGIVSKISIVRTNSSIIYEYKVINKDDSRWYYEEDLELLSR